MGIGTGAVIGGLVRGRSGWTDAPTLALIGGGLLLLAGFTLVEARKKAPTRPSEPGALRKTVKAIVD